MERGQGNKQMRMFYIKYTVFSIQNARMMEGGFKKLAYVLNVPFASPGVPPGVSFGTAFEGAFH